MTLAHALLGFVAGLLIATVTAPVGVSGAVFLLPVQLSVLHIPNPSVTPTNLLFNVIAGTLPGVIIGSAIHIHFASGPRTFRILAAAVLLPIGVWLLLRDPKRSPRESHQLTPRAITGLALIVGIVGGIYGIGGGVHSRADPGRQRYLNRNRGPRCSCLHLRHLRRWCTDLRAARANHHRQHRTELGLGLTCGAGGLIGGYLGARLQPRLPETGLRLLLGSLAIALAVAYLVQALTRFSRQGGALRGGKGLG